MADGTVRVQIRTGPRLQTRAGIVRIGLRCQFSRRLGEGVGEQPQVLEHTQLVVFQPAVIVQLVHLRFRQADYEIGCAAVTGAALGPTWKTPDLTPRPTEGAPVLDREFFFPTGFPNERGIRLRVVPTIGVAGPLAVPANEQPGLDPPA